MWKCGVLAVAFFFVVLFGFVNGELQMKWLKFHPLQHNLYKHGPSEGQGSFSFNLKNFQSPFNVFYILFPLCFRLLGSAPLRWFKMLHATLTNDSGRWVSSSIPHPQVFLRSPVGFQSSVEFGLAFFVKMHSPMTLQNGSHFFRII